MRLSINNTKLRVLVVSDDNALNSGFGTVCRNLFRRLAKRPEFEVTQVGLFSLPTGVKREVDTVCNTQPFDEYGTEMVGEYCDQKGQPDIIFLLGDWWYWKDTLLNPGWRSEKRIFSDVWYYAPVDSLQMTTVAYGAYTGADMLVSMSPFGHRMLTQYTDREPVYLPHGYDPELFTYERKPFKGRRVTFGVVARNSRRKHLWATLSAFRGYVEGGNPDARLLLHTAKNDRPGGNLEAYIRYFEIPNVTWTGGMEIATNMKTMMPMGVTDGDMVRLYRDIDILVSTGREGFGLPYLEGRVCGCGLVLPEFSAHYSMEYPDAVTYPVSGYQIEPQSPDVIDMVPDVPAITKAMITAVKQYRKSPPAEFDTDGVLTWDTLADTLAMSMLKRGKCKRLQQLGEMHVLQKSRTIYGDGVLVTMPASTGDVLLVTATLDSLKKKYPDRRIVFATGRQYFGVVQDCPAIDEVVEFNPYMHDDYTLMHKRYAHVFTPHFVTQRWANWVHGGDCKTLAEVYAEHCGVPLGKYWLPQESVGDLPKRYFTIHIGSGAGEQSARWYRHWQTVVDGLGKRSIIQVGTSEDRPLEGVIDKRGCYDFRETYYVLARAQVHIGIDSFPMHAAALLKTQCVILWGNTFPHATGPEPRYMGYMTAVMPPEYPCGRPCHMLECHHDELCVDGIDPEKVIQAIKGVAGK